MITREDIKKLADLARIKLSDEQEQSLQKEMGAILGYVDQIKKAASTSVGEPEVGEPHNVMREDINPHESGIHTEKILSEAPAREGNYLKVKKIL